MNLTIYLILLMTLIYFIEDLPGFFENFSFIPSQALQKPWMFVTSIFLHANFIHLFYNMFALFFFGNYLESLVGRKTFSKIFLISGIFGNIIFFLLNINSNIPAVGASGAIFGIIGALASLKPYAIVYVYFVPMPLIVAALLWAVGEFVGMFLPSSIAHAAHFGGLLVGYLYGEFLKKIFAKRYIRRIRWY